MTRRRYTKPEKLAAVMAAEMAGITAAAEQTGIPKTTIDYWMDLPEFVQFRTKTRENLHEEVTVVAHLAWKRIAQALVSGEMEPRDAIFAAEKSTTLMQLLGGEATERTETRSLTDGLDDHEAEVLGQVIRDELARRAHEEAAATAVEGAAPTGAETA